MCMLCKYEEERVGGEVSEVSELLNEFDHGAKKLKAEYTFEILQHLSKSLNHSIQQIRITENTIRAYSETERSRKNLIAHFPRVPSELIQAKITYAKAKVRIRHQLLSLKRYIEEPPSRAEPRFDEHHGSFEGEESSYYHKNEEKHHDHKNRCSKKSGKAAGTKFAVAGSAKHEMQDDSNMIDSSDIVCCVCHDGSSCDDNDVIMCDGKRCFRAFHMRCLRPQLSREVLKNLRPGSDTWFCPFCTKVIRSSNSAICRGIRGLFACYYLLTSIFTHSIAT